MPGKYTFAEIALLPNGTDQTCLVPVGQPEIHAASRVHVTGTGTNRVVTVTGAKFGATKGTGSIILGGKTMTTSAWSDTSITFAVPTAGSGTTQIPAGPHQLSVRTGAGAASAAGITIHVLGAGYNPAVRTVSPTQSVQAAIDSAPVGALIVLAPGVHYENVIMNRALKLQGMGPGSPAGDGGSVINGKFFDDTPVTDAWVATLGRRAFAGNPDVARESVITVVAPDTAAYAAARPRIDGLRLTGGRGEAGHGGAGIHVNAYARSLQITNNVVQDNAGGMGGGVTIGEPYAGDNQNDNVRVAYNRILNNGGARFSGGVLIANGAGNYEVDHNEVCGNSSFEYGAGISNFGRSPGTGTIHDNAVLWNDAFDEGGGIMVAGELPQAGTALTAGSGNVAITANVVKGNKSNNDGGGIRLLQPRNGAIDIVNNTIVNNVSTDIGGGIALDNAPNTRIVNNTVANNATTATAASSDGSARAAGIASVPHNPQFAFTGGTFSDPVMFNNILSNNLAYTWNGQDLVRSGVIDLGVVGPAPVQYLHPTNSTLTAAYGAPMHPSNRIVADPAFLAPFELALDAAAVRDVVDFVIVTIRTVAGGTLAGNYHLGATSPARAVGAAQSAVNGAVRAPLVDIDGTVRPAPAGGAPDAGSDEIP
jgi:hypothetical protein